jgi:N-terminal acetyltransferase B complex catalytic subunit
MRPDDLLAFSTTNLDHLTETYNIGFYLEYLTKWPELCQVIEGMDGQIEGYSKRENARERTNPQLTRPRTPQSSANSNPRLSPRPSNPTRPSKSAPCNRTTSPGTATSQR